MIRIVAMLVAGVCSLATIAALADNSKQQISGIPSVIDGDTLDLHGERIRMNGIDAPESDQVCQKAGERWPCGRRAAQALDETIAHQTVNCSVTGTDRYGRSLATCFLGAKDLNDWMVRNGWAVAYRQYSETYVPAEDEAHLAQRGLWAGEFEAPWDWRRRKRGN